MSANQSTHFTDEVLEIVNMSVGKQIGRDSRSLGADENLFDLGLTSIGFISLIVEIEQRFGVVFEEDELDLSNFRSLSAINAEISRKRTKQSLAERA
jgi:acyl carrier protein